MQINLIMIIRALHLDRKQQLSKTCQFISEPVQGVAIHVHLHRGMEIERILCHELLPIHSHRLHQGTTHAAQHDAHQTLRGGGESERGKGHKRRAQRQNRPHFGSTMCRFTNPVSTKRTSSHRTLMQPLIKLLCNLSSNFHATSHQTLMQPLIKLSCNLSSNSHATSHRTFDNTLIQSSSNGLEA